MIMFITIPIFKLFHYLRFALSNSIYKKWKVKCWSKNNGEFDKTNEKEDRACIFAIVISFRISGYYSIY